MTKQIYNKNKQQRFKAKTKFEYRPVINNGKQKVDEGTSMSNKFELLDSGEASEVFGSKGDGVTVGKISQNDKSEGATMGVITSLEGSKKENNSVDKKQSLNKEDDSDGDDVEIVFEEPKLHVVSKKSENTGASTPATEVSNV